MSWRTPAFEPQRKVEVHPAAPQLYRRKDEILAAAAQAPSWMIVDGKGTRWAHEFCWLINPINYSHILLYLPHTIEFTFVSSTNVRSLKMLL
jgi:hypothetical protein